MKRFAGYLHTAADFNISIKSKKTLCLQKVSLYFFPLKVDNHDKSVDCNFRNTKMQFKEFLTMFLGIVKKSTFFPHWDFYKNIFSFLSYMFSEVQLDF